MKTTAYFREQVLRKRPYLTYEYCFRIIANPVAKQVQDDGRIRFWGYVPELGDKVGNKAIRVRTLADGETIMNAFPDRNFRRTEP